MPRPKGSKNKKTIAAAAVVDNVNYDEKIAAIEAEIAALNDQLKEKKAELKAAQKGKANAEAAALAKKVEEDKAALLKAFENSGKTVDDIVAFIKGE